MRKELLLLLLFIGQMAFSQAGTLDTSFNPGTAVNFGSYSQTINTAVIQSDGKIIAGGNFSSFNGEPYRGLVRLNPNGSIDTSFAIGQGLGYSNPQPAVYALAIQPDGKIIVAGKFGSFNGVVKIGLLRLNTDGSIDTSFNSVRIGDSIFSIDIQTDGKIIVAGNFTSHFTTDSNGFNTFTPCKAILRFNSDGSLDNTFNVGLGPLRNGGVGEIKKIKIQTDGKILVGGSFYAFDTKYGNGLARLNTNGSVDAGFEIYQGFQNPSNNYSVVTDIDLLPDQSMFITGDFSTFDGITSNRFIKLLPTGYKDWNFSIDSSLNLFIKNTSIQNNGKIVLCATGYNNGVYIWNAIRLNADGTNDNSFVSGNNFNDLPIFSIIQPDGKLIYFGPFTAYDGISILNIARIIGDTPELTVNENNHSELVVYPNPASDHILLQLSSGALSIDKIIVSDMSGKILLQQSINTHKVDIQNFAVGTYIIQTFSGENKYTTKFIKE